MKFNFTTFSLLLTITFLLLLPSYCFSQSGGTLAKVGDNIISPEEFKYRFELSPHIFPRDETDVDSMKVDFLYSIIAEKLWADEASKMGFTNNARFLFFFTPLKDMYVRDALFQEEIKSKVNISSDDIVEGVRKIASTLDLSMITSGNKNTIDTIYKQLSSGAEPDSLVHEHRDVYLARQDINFGDLRDEDLENKLYSLLPGMITGPVKSDNSYTVFYLNGKNDNRKLKDIQDVDEEVKKIISNRRTERQYNKYLNKLLSGITVVPYEKSFYTFADAVMAALTEQKMQPVKEDSTHQKFYLDETAVYRIKSDLSKETLNRTLFDVNNKSFSLSDFLAYFSLNDFSVETLEKQKVYSALSQTLKDFIRLSIITIEGYRQNLQNSAGVKEQLSMWKSNYLAQMYKNQFLDSVSISDDDVYEYYLKSLKGGSGIKQVKVLEFRTDSLAYFEKIFDEMDKGRDFKDIINSINLSGKDTEVKESGFFAVTANEVGRAADKMKPGDVYGPLKRFNSYEVFQLLDVKETADSVLKEYESVKEGIRQELIYKTMAARLTDNTKGLLSKYHIEVNPEALQNIDTGSMNMFVHRYMGFGGRIAAVPFTSPIIEYKKIRQIMQEVLP